MSRYVFLTAARNESPIVPIFLEEFDRTVRELGIAARTTLWVVDDYSVDDTRQALLRRPPGEWKLELLEAASNFGNQGAMFLGLRRLELAPDDLLVTFDCDGEDDLRQLASILKLQAEHPDKLVLIERGRRAESLKFRVSFALYKLLFRFLTGKRTIPNNFMVIPGRYLPAIQRAPLAAVHLAYGILRLGLPHVSATRDRRTRYGGHSSQSMFALVSHGLVGLMVFYEVVVAKLLVLLLMVVGIGAALLVVLLTVEDPFGLRIAAALALATTLGTLALLGLLLAAALALAAKVTVYNLIARDEPRAGTPGGCSAGAGPDPSSARSESPPGTG